MKQDIVNTFKNGNELDHMQFEVIDAQVQQKYSSCLGAERDLYSPVWSKVADSLCLGASERIPFVRHGLYKTKWEPIGKILQRGFLKANYFATILSKVSKSFETSKVL